MERELGNSTVFTSVTDYKNYEKLLFIDVDSAPANQLANYAGVDATSLTWEFRLNGETDSARWVAGFFYLNIDNTSDNGLKAAVNSIAGSAPFSPVDIGVVADLQTDSYSFFGQLDYDISDTLSATLGMRVIREEKEFDLGIGIFHLRVTTQSTRAILFPMHWCRGRLISMKRALRTHFGPQKHS